MTVDMVDNLQHKTIHALLWSFLEVVAQKGAQFIIGIVLARLLFPEQFGLIGMLVLFMAVMRAFLSSGFGAALIQKRKVTQTDICSIFYFNILVGLAASGVLCLVAPWISAFYNQPILTPLTRALSLTIVIDSFGMIQSIILTKEINFKAQTKVSLIAGALSGIAGITLAALGFGVWSLVAQQVSASLFSTICLWSFSAWRPALIFSFRALWEMFGFGSRMLVAGILNPIFENIYFVVIGKLFSPADLGFFARAKTLQDVPSETLSVMVGRVTFPVFSTIQDDPARLKRGLKKAVTILAMVNFPMMIGLAVVARPLVLVMLTEKWAPVIPYLQLLCVAGILSPVPLMNLNVLLALGRSDLFLRLDIIKRVLVIINIAVILPWGILAMLYGMIAQTIICLYVNTYYTGRLVHYPLWKQLRDLFSYFTMAAVMGMVIYAAGLLPFPNHWSMLLVQVVIGIVTYVSLCKLFRLTAFMEILQVCWGKMPLLRTET